MVVMSVLLSKKTERLSIPMAIACLRLDLQARASAMRGEPTCSWNSETLQIVAVCMKKIQTEPDRRVSPLIPGGVCETSGILQVPCYLSGGWNSMSWSRLIHIFIVLCGDPIPWGGDVLRATSSFGKALFPMTRLFLEIQNFQHTQGRILIGIPEGGRHGIRRDSVTADSKSCTVARWAALDTCMKLQTFCA